MGEKYRNEVLAHGGGKHPAELVEGTSFHSITHGKGKNMQIQRTIVFLFAATALTDNCTTSTFVHNTRFIQFFTNLAAVQSVNQ